MGMPVYSKRGKWRDTKRRTITQPIPFSSPPQTKENQSLPHLHLHIPTTAVGVATGNSSSHGVHTLYHTHTSQTQPDNLPLPLISHTPPTHDVSIHLRAVFSQVRILPDRTHITERVRWVSPVGSSDQLHVWEGPQAVFVAERDAE